MKIVADNYRIGKSTTYWGQDWEPEFLEQLYNEAQEEFEGSDVEVMGRLVTDDKEYELSFRINGPNSIDRLEVQEYGGDYVEDEAFIDKVNDLIFGYINLEEDSEGSYEDEEVTVCAKCGTEIENVAHHSGGDWYDGSVCPECKYVNNTETIKRGEEGLSEGEIKLRKLIREFLLKEKFTESINEMFDHPDDVKDASDLPIWKQISMKIQGVSEEQVKYNIENDLPLNWKGSKEGYYEKMESSKNYSGSN